MADSRPRTEYQEGIALLGAMMIVLVLSLLGVTLLNLAGQEGISAAAGRDAGVAQHLADAAGEMVVAWFHDNQTMPSSAVSILAKRNLNAGGASSFFDQTGRSQFVGTVDRPDLILNATNLSDARMLNDHRTGLFRAMQDLGLIEELRMYAPSRPGLLCTVDVTVSTKTSRSVRQSVVMQLAALDVPPLRAAVQVGQHLGAAQTGKESPVDVHWGDLKVNNDLVIRRVNEIPIKTVLAPVTGRPYDEISQREDRWLEAWIGGQVKVTQPPLGPGQAPNMPHNVHVQQTPVPGVTLDQWPYEQLKRIAKQYGSYFAIDREGLLYPQGMIEPGHGISPDDVLQSQAVGDQRGLIFIDTLDQAAPRADNLGTVTIRAPYVEGLIVMQGHLVFAPGGVGQSLSVLSPPQSDRDGRRTPVQLSRIRVNGALYTAGNITVSGEAQVFGSVTAEGTIVPAGSGGTLEVWYNHDYAQGLYKGLPVVYRAPGTWLARY